MAGKAKAVGTVVRLGVKYGPQVWVATQALREPAKQAVQQMIASERARRSAVEHARTLHDGSVLKVYLGDQSLWVVFSGDEAVTVHPPTDLPLSRLLTGADLTKRVRPEDAQSRTDRIKDAATSGLRRGHPDTVN